MTLATNMAGRGTDIILGGNPDALYKQQVVYRGEDLTDEQKRAAFERIQGQCETEKEEVLELGGLHIVGTERHESRRIDNQLRGRSGRQGDPGSSRFFLSLEDDLMRIFASERVSNLMLKLGMEEGVPIEHRMVSKSIENAQKKVEGHNFDIRKHILEYDDVMNKQREIIYAHRAGVLGGSSIQDDAEEWLVDVVDALINVHCPEEAYAEAWDLAGLHEAVLAQFGTDVMATGDMSEMDGTAYGTNCWNAFSSFSGNGNRNAKNKSVPNFARSSNGAWRYRSSTIIGRTIFWGWISSGTASG